MAKRIEYSELQRIKRFLNQDGYRNVVNHIEALESEIDILQKLVRELTEELARLTEK